MYKLVNQNLMIKRLVFKSLTIKILVVVGTQ